MAKERSPGVPRRRAADIRRAGFAAAMGLAAAGLGQPPARAQTVNSGVGITPSQQVNQAPPAPPPLEHVFGDWGGLRTYLAGHGIDLTLDWTTEFAGNVSGGPKRGSTYAGQVGFQADIDWGKLAGLTGFSTHVIVVNRQGSSDSALFGDRLIPVQEIYGSGGNVGVHLVAAYAEQSLLGGMVDVAAGHVPVLNDFAASTLYCNRCAATRRRCRARMSA
jgi:porin